MPKPDLRAVSSELPDPPYPADTEAGSFNLDVNVRRFFGSTTWALTDGDVIGQCILTWFVSWDQVPCGSLPNNDEELAVRLKCSKSFFDKHRSEILRGWNLHSDGRLYHPVITERVLKFLATRAAWKGRSKKRYDKKTDDSHESLTRETSVTHERLTPVSPPSSSSSASSSASKEKNIGQKSAEPTKKASAGEGCQGHSASDRHGFEEFWRIWPKKVARKPAMSAWTRLTTTKKKAVLNHLARNPFDGKDMQFVPNPATFLNGERWLDETSAKTSAAQHMVGAI